MRTLIVAALLGVGCLSAQTIPFMETFDDGVFNNNNVPNTYWQTSTAATNFNGQWLTNSGAGHGTSNDVIMSDQSGTPGNHFLFFYTQTPSSSITSIIGNPGGIFYLSPAIAVPMDTYVTLSWYTALQDSINPPTIMPIILTPACAVGYPSFNTSPPAIPSGCIVLFSGTSQSTASQTPGFWVQSSYSFSTGSNTSIVIALVDNTNTAIGNDFGLDTITLDVGYIEVCKVNSTTSPVPPNGIYSYTVTNSNFSSGNSPLQVAVGECSGPIAVAPGIATIMELPMAGAAVSDITVNGYSQSGNSPLTISTNYQTGEAMVVVQPALGGTSGETIVTYTNYDPPPALLKICKVAAYTSVTGIFPFTVTIGIKASAPLTVSAQNEVAASV